MGTTDVDAQNEDSGQLAPMAHGSNGEANVNMAAQDTGDEQDHDQHRYMQCRISRMNCALGW